ncbi:hypothetical protein ANCCEY_06130 [Ancylostoma ceylanicum]|uniref:Uncharacterized protein n=1 Tax=Ancylostoma ceylanicum TaxID=53326 RepID=A0A0D6LRU1_9BILA|nr:hypothetical protein ANCCEY_06130 [Ancylostoma ceylanicum]
MQQLIAATCSAMEDVAVTRITSLTSMSAEGHAEEDGSTMQQLIAATCSAMEDVAVTRITSLTSMSAEGHAEEGIWITQLQLKPARQRWDRLNCEGGCAKESLRLIKKTSIKIKI